VAEEIRASAADEAEEVLARARASARDILARAHNEAAEIISEARQRIPSTVGPPNPALAGKRRNGQRRTSWTRLGPTPMASFPMQGRG
jgi:cell division septum initiation protein DivIVA